MTGSSYINHFLQPDTIIPDPANPQAFNRYSYVANNPINFNDPTGHKWDDCSNVKGDYRCKIHMKHAGPAIAEGNRRAEEKRIAATDTNISNYSGLTIGNAGAITIGAVGYGVSMNSLSFFDGVNGSINTVSDSFTIPPLNVVLPFGKIGIYGNDALFYILPFGLRVTTQPSMGLNNNGNITIGPDRIVSTINPGGVALRGNINSNHTSNLGIFTFNKLNDSVEQSMGISIPSWLAPQQLDVTLTPNIAVNVPYSSLSVSANLPVTISVRYNPHTTALGAVGVGFYGLGLLGSGLLGTYGTTQILIPE